MLTVNVSRFNSPIKKHHLTNWSKKEDPTICCLQETHLINGNKHWLKVKAGRRSTKPMVPENRQG
jgi:exonuclease III